MINKIIDGVLTALHDTFGANYKLYTENVKQGLDTPCFFISCVNPTHRPYHGDRYLKEHLLSVQYISENTETLNEELNSISERLNWTLEVINVDGKKVRGLNMSSRVTDDILTFMVTYNIFVDLVKSSDVMDDMTVSMKGR